ncbi:hypothetical protein [Nocardiopsis synnemataformans]|uniref:hypothetical protein n=1 Tax=Nocardiopsis synnemataformans TaxID=61305 RepID=UPI003EBEE2F1
MTYPRITVRTAISITARDGFLDQAAVAVAARELGDTPVGGVVAVHVHGRVSVVMPDALLPVGHLLADATEVDVAVAGRGLPALVQAVKYAIDTERGFRAHDEQSRLTRLASLERQVAAGYLPADVLAGEVPSERR